MDRRSVGVFVNKLIFAVVIGIFVFASYSISASLAFMIPSEFGRDQNCSSLPSHFMPTGTPNFPDTPLSPNPDEDELPAALRSFCEAFCNTGTFNFRARNKTVSQLEAVFLTFADGSCPPPSILELNFYGSEHICAKAFYSVKTTRKLE